MATTTKDKELKFTAVYRSADGTVREAKIVGKDERDVETRLISQGYVPINVEQAEGAGLNREIKLNIGGRVKQKDIAQWMRQFATMNRSGLSVARSLSVLAQQTEKEKLRDITNQIRNTLEGGASLSEAMAEHIDLFGDLIINMVNAGEQGGFLEGALDQIAKNLEADVKLRAKVKSAMTYPVVVLIMAIVLSAGMLIGIVPIFEKMFTQMGGTLPLPTQVLVLLSDFLRVGIVPIVIALVGFSFWWRKNKRNQRIREFIDPKKLRVPIFGKLSTKIALSRFSRNLGTLISSGVPILQALDIVSTTVGNVVISRGISDVKLSVAKGESISGPLSEHPIFPPMVVQMVAVGEESGTIATMLNHVADDYDQQIETTTEQLASLIEPLMIAFLGVVVGGMIVALYMPIFSIYTLVK